MSTTAAFRPVEVRRGPLVAWLLALAGGIAAMVWLGQGHLATPSLADPGAWSGWLQGRDPLIAAMAVFRLLVLAIAWYLVGVTGISLVAHVARAARLVRLADALAVPVVRRITQQAVGIALATAAVASVSHAPAPRAVSPPVAAGTSLSAAVSDETLALRPLEPEVLSMRTQAPDAIAMDRLDVAEDGAPGADGETVAMRSVDADGAPATEAYTVRMQRLATADDAAQGSPEAAPAAVADDTAPPADDARTHVVTPGDHLWSIAEDTLADAWGRAPSDDEIEPYWRDLIEENRSRLSNPDDPDLLLPGQTLTLPAAPTAP